MSCPACFQGHEHEGTPRGRVTKLHGLDTYVTEPADGRIAKGVIVIIPDAFGWEFVNNRILADHYADKGDYRVYLPDFMNGHSAPVSLIQRFRDVSKPGILSKTWTIPTLLYGFVPFIIANRFGKTYPVVKSFFTALRDPSSPDASLPVGAAGFCWGGKHTLLLAADTAETNGHPLIDAGFAGHPSMMDVPGDAEKLIRPVSFAVGDKDNQVSLEACEKIRGIVEQKDEPKRGEMIVYEGCGHGFCVRADVATDESVAKQAAEAEDQCVRWFDRRFGFKA